MAAKAEPSVEQILELLANICYVHNRTKHKGIDQFPVLEKLLRKSTENKHSKDVLTLFPYIAHLALKMETYFPTGELPILRSHQSCHIIRKAVATLVAACMLGCYPDQKPQNLPSPHDFMYFYQSDQPISFEKLRFYLHYFRTVREQEPKGYIRISRYTLPDEVALDPDYLLHVPSLPLPEVEVQAEGKIEELEGTLRVDFANKFIGGGCMHAGAVQEEILFLIYPELLVSRMVNMAMKDHDAIFIRGVQRYASYEGYSKGCKFAGGYHDKLAEVVKSDAECINVDYVAIDALHFRTPAQQLGQLGKRMIDRELKKTIAGFRAGIPEKVPVTTGRWGCGAFKGNAQLKFLIQWIAAGFCGRKMIFCSFGDKSLKDAAAVVKLYRKHTALALYKRVLGVCNGYMKAHGKKVDSGAKLTADFAEFIFNSLLSSVLVMF